MVVGAPAHHGGVTDEQPEPGDVHLFDRLVAAGLSIKRIEQHLTAGRVRVDGELVTDPCWRWTEVRPAAGR